MSEEDKELQKLTANWINGMAIGAVTAGIITPVAGYFLGVVKPEMQDALVTSSVLWFVASVGAHIAAHISLFGYGEP
ncbi:hypothetical protein [Methylobacterium sp. GC_Met_2]|uniref:hypothetical protein n=1 Tax=Methylobacterium sp. GC_Met_2 TaxID=2937376 RepID=UPI00226BA0DB|nr:hypothetical protein [Methylobacterium sp. GC_Met_2]